MKTCLTIAGSDCSGGAGIQADLKTFLAHNVYGMSVVTSVVAENTCGVLDLFHLSPSMIEKQMDAVFTDIYPHGVKVGMLASQEIMEVVAKKLKEYAHPCVVFDPVMAAKDNSSLMDPRALEVLKEQILPRCFMITPNLPEAEILIGEKIESLKERKEAARKISEMGVKNVLIKGGHLKDEPEDLLYAKGEFYLFQSRRILTKNTHGTGCTLSSAITANLALGMDPQEAVRKAKEYVTGAILYSLELGKGNGPLHHFFAYDPCCQKNKK